jgi:hypothetical protein
MGIGIASMGVLLMFIAMLINTPLLFSLFLPMIMIYFVLCFILAHTSMIAMEGIVDKAHGAVVMSFINMLLPILAVFTLTLFPIKTLLLPAIYLILCVAMLGAFKGLRLMHVRLKQI